VENDTGIIENQDTSSAEVIETQSNDLATDLANDLFPKEAKDSSDDSVDDSIDDAIKEPVEPVKPAVEAKPAPKSWTKEMQAKYGTLPPDVQDYVALRETQMQQGLEKDRNDANLGRVMRDTMTPYRALLQAQGVDEVKAVQSLMNVHYRLTNLPAGDKANYFAQLAKGYGIDINGIPKEQEHTVDPTIKKLQDELNGIRQTLTASQERTIQQAKEKVVQDVEAFASDKNHPYFDEIADDIAGMIQAGHDLKTAYEKAVWANPVTRQKEIARLNTEHEATLREKAKQEAETARKKSGINVKTRDTSRTPTGPKATMKNLDSALEESMREIRSKIH
jgi:hypothetical protein